MNYVQSLNLFGVEAKEIPCITGSGAPTTATVGAVGLFYMNTNNGDVYKCTAVSGSAYTWVPMASASSDSGGNADQSGMSEELKTALVNYYTHVMPNFDDTNGLAYINAILTALGAETRGESGGEETPDEPVAPDEPEVTLSSITATYSGGDVAVGTAVTDLTGIVVTAHYSDGTSEAVTGYTLSGTIAEGSNTITVSYGGKTATFAVTGVSESGGDTGGTVDVALTESAQIGFAVDAYSDDGSAGTVVNISGYNPSQHTAEYFTEDTEVTITFNKTGTIGTRKAAAFCAPAEATIFNKGYYYQELGTFNDIIASEGVKYTVRAGHKLYVAEINGGPSQGTFAATRAGADGDGVMETYEISGTEVVMTSDKNGSPASYTWYSDAGETIAANPPTKQSAFVAISTETFNEDTDVVVEMYHATATDKIWVASYNADGCHYTERINDIGVKMSNRPAFVYTVRAGHQLIVASDLTASYEIKVVK